MERKIKYLITPDVEDLTYRLKCAVQNLNVVHDAMEHGAWEMEFYIPAIYASWLLLDALAVELQQMVDGAQAVNVPIKEATV